MLPDFSGSCFSGFCVGVGAEAGFASTLEGSGALLAAGVGFAVGLPSTAFVSVIAAVDTFAGSAAFALSEETGVFDVDAEAPDDLAFATLGTDPVLLAAALSVLSAGALPVEVGFFALATLQPFRF
jgi:hypothetical protein